MFLIFQGLSDRTIKNAKNMANPSSEFFNQTVIQNIHIETYFILILKTRITGLEGY